MANISKLKDGDEPHARKTKILRDKFSYIIELQKPENNNAKTGAPNFYKVSKQTGIDRVQLMKWWKKKDEILAALPRFVIQLIYGYFRRIFLITTILKNLGNKYNKTIA